MTSQKIRLERVWNSLNEIEIIYQKYYKFVKGYAFTLCFDESLAEDITQETFFNNRQRLYKGWNYWACWINWDALKYSEAIPLFCLQKGGGDHSWAKLLFCREYISGEIFNTRILFRRNGGWYLLLLFITLYHPPPRLN